MLLPISLRIEGKICVLVGGGPIAAHKCGVLLEHGAKVRVVAESFNDEALWMQAGVERIQASYETAHLAGASLAIAATSDPETNSKIVQDCRAARIFVLCVNAPEECDWMMPATLRRGAFTVSFGTDGLLPALAARVKRDSLAIYGEDLALRCEEAREFRRSAKLESGDAARDRSPLGELAASLDEFWYLEGARKHSAEDAEGKVYLVGAGPGDVGLITVKGTECLRRATVVVHDALANSKLLDMYCNGALRIDVSKRKGMCQHMQPEINQMLIDWARKGHTVVRLKGGDPMIFGRGGEEARALAAAGVDFEIVPGVSSLSAVPAYAGIPVTDREYGAASVGIYSLHRRNGGGLNDEQWRKMAQGPETLVLFMGMTLLSTVVEKLRKFGLNGKASIALITQGTTAEQHEVVGTLDTILGCCAGQELQGPGLIVVGDVVQAKSLMSWFDPASAAKKASRRLDLKSHRKLMLEIVLIRHTEIDEKYRECYIGSSDVSLGETGRRQAAALASDSALCKPGKVFASPMLRVQQTVNAVLSSRECAWTDDLREIDFGFWENRTFAEVAKSDPVHAASWARLDGSFAFPGGESLESFQRRIAHAADAMLEQASADECCERIFIYSHGLVIRFLIGHWLGLPLRACCSLAVSYGSISTLSFYGDRCVLTRLNDTAQMDQVEPNALAETVSQ
jgi:uroporphyrin-III C-methyltransferase/precorrin-2 dehydrogenase/sirohydrochlorin ferrochelatase